MQKSSSLPGFVWTWNSGGVANCFVWPFQRQIPVSLGIIFRQTRENFRFYSMGLQWYPLDTNKFLKMYYKDAETRQNIFEQFYLIASICLLKAYLSRFYGRLQPQRPVSWHASSDNEPFDLIPLNIQGLNQEKLDSILLFGTKFSVFPGDVQYE